MFTACILGTKFYHAAYLLYWMEYFSLNRVCSLVGSMDGQKVNKDAFSITNCDTDLKQTNKKGALIENNGVEARPT